MRRDGTPPASSPQQQVDEKVGGGGCREQIGCQRRGGSTLELLFLQGNFGAQLRFGAANFRVPSERGSPPGIFKCARPRSTGTPRNRGRAREGKEHFEGGFHFFQKFSKGRTSVPDTRDLEPHCRRPCPPLREKWCGGGGGDDPICLPRKKLGGKALRRGSGTAGEAQGRKKGTQGRVSEIFKCNKTC